MTYSQLVGIGMKIQDNLIAKQNVENRWKQKITLKLKKINKKLGSLKQKNKQLTRRVSVAENTSNVYLTNLKNTNENVKTVEKQLCKMK